MTLSQHLCSQKKEDNPMQGGHTIFMRMMIDDVGDDAYDDDPDGGNDG